MKTTFLLSACLIILLIACRKDKFQTVPQLKIKEVNRTTVSGDQVLRFTIRITDKEGDFTTLLGVKKTIPSCPAGNFTDSVKFKIPQSFLDAKLREGEIELTLDRFNRGPNVCRLPGNVVKPDTATFSFWTKDKAGNISDTVTSEQIIINN